MKVIGEVFTKSKFPITFLNITQLSSYRKDAHTSIYKQQWNPLTLEQLANPVSYADCVHWCFCQAFQILGMSFSLPSYSILEYSFQL